MRNYPSLLKLPSFTTIAAFLKSLQTQPKAGCGSCAKKKQIQANRSIFETALNQLSDEEKTRIKTILNTKELCYYSVNKEGKLTLACF